MTEPRRAQIVGTGLIGGSIGQALRGRGWYVSGWDDAVDVAERAVELGAIDAVQRDADAEVTFVATPVGAVRSEVRAALDAGARLVTDVGSVKTPMLELMDDPRFVGGHPMAGSELEGVDGSRPDLFEGATWVLTPVPGTDDAAFAEVRSLVSSFGAAVVAIPPDRHDALVAMVSHVPHLTAATMMRRAAARSEEHQAVLRLAAGGFRDMTRIAAGHPGIWPDICAENRDAIVAELDELIEGLRDVRTIVADGERDRLLDVLGEARRARVNLPARVARPEDLVELRLTIPDRKGVLGPIFMLATDLDVSIVDFEVAHSMEGPEGVLIMVVDADRGERFRGGLMANGYRPSMRPVE